MKLQLLVLFCTSLILPGFLYSHDLYIRPQSFILEKSQTTEIKMLLAEAFPGKEIEWRKDKTVEFVLVNASGRKKMQEPASGNPSVQLQQTGTQVIGWTATPSYIEINPPLFQEYIEAEGYSNVVQMREESGQKEKPGREKYVRFLKSFIQVGSDLTETYKQSLGYKIEIIPSSNPYSIKRGQEMEVQLLFDGKPLPGATVMATFDTYSKEHDAYAQTVKTDSEGRARISIEKAGVWMIRANHMLPLEGDEKADWVSYWANCSFQVR